MKRHLTQKCTPLLALFLSLVLLLSGMVPLSYFSFAAAEFSAEVSAPEAAEEPTALYELTELRQADTKYIQMSDGTVRALVYDTAVHRPDGQEGYTEIDNRLSEKGDGVENADARIKFSKKITGNARHGCPGRHGQHKSSHQAGGAFHPFQGCFLGRLQEYSAADRHRIYPAGGQLKRKHCGECPEGKL